MQFLDNHLLYYFSTTSFTLKDCSAFLSSRKKVPPVFVIGHPSQNKGFGVCINSLISKIIFWINDSQRLKKNLVSQWRKRDRKIKTMMKKIMIPAFTHRGAFCCVASTSSVGSLCSILDGLLRSYMKVLKIKDKILNVIQAIIFFYRFPKAQ